ncbi:MAG: nucleotidyl transferase AbiEii/AbiGii toxin family protein [Clostridia bacterium]|nr:nucleotidyl transferase AbiEii/AbiGii toxin family protein [Clostridia bacterium]
MLHNNKELFEQTVLAASEALNIELPIVEKDYYVTMFLKKIVEKQPDIVFKGGTSLSKCYKLIDRFSEDIDLNLLGESKPGESRRRKLKANIVFTIEGFGFSLVNTDQIRSRRDFNKYIISYPSSISANYLKPDLIVETAVFFRSYPTKTMSADSLVYQYLKSNDFEELIEEYELEPFDINVQTADRTMVDKLYALGDYYLSGKTDEHSRHIYDLHKLSEIVEIDDSFLALMEQVRKEREPHKTCLSAQNNVNLSKLLQEIIDSEVYKSDYESKTYNMLYKKVGYDEAIQSLQKIINKI